MGFLQDPLGTIRDAGEDVKSVYTGVAKSVSDVVSEVGTGIKNAAVGLQQAWGQFSQRLGPIGTIALIMAMPYIASWAAESYAVGATVAETAAISSVGASSVASSVASGAISTSQGMSALSAGIGEAAALGGAGATSLYTSAALGETAALTVAEASLGLGATLAPYSAEIGAFEASEALAFTDTTGAGAIGAPEAEGFDYTKAGKKALKTLASLGGGGQVVPVGGAGFDPSIPALRGTTAVDSLSSAAGGGLGFSRFTEEAQPLLTGAARKAEEQYKSLLARGY